MIPCYDRGLIMEDFVCEDFKFYLTKSQGHFKRGWKQKIIKHAAQELNRNMWWQPAGWVEDRAIYTHWPLY